MRPARSFHNFPKKGASHLPLILLALLAGGCVNDPVTTGERLAAAGGAGRQVMSGAGFEHVVFSRGLGRDVHRLHVYIGGDGRAFVNRHRVARDPTARHPLALELMLTDPAPSAYVARPCYHGPPPGGCHPLLWTTQRYSEQVLASMAQVIGNLSEHHPQASITLIGYSGGGVIATLVAPRVARVQRVVTIAAPLDVTAWTRTHGYTPLDGSLNPAEVVDWPPTLHQLHLHGGRDRNVAPELIDAFRAGAQAGGWPARFRIIETFDHVCCWREAWPGLLAELIDGEAAHDWDQPAPSS